MNIAISDPYAPPQTYIDSKMQQQIDSRKFGDGIVHARDKCYEGRPVDSLFYNQSSIRKPMTSQGGKRQRPKLDQLDRDMPQDG